MPLVPVQITRHVVHAVTLAAVGWRVSDTGKKKRFFKLKNFKQLFTRKKRPKSKDEAEAGPSDDSKSKSTNNVYPGGGGAGSDDAW